MINFELFKERRLIYDEEGGFFDIVSPQVEKAGVAIMNATASVLESGAKVIGKVPEILDSGVKLIGISVDAVESGVGLLKEGTTVLKNGTKSIIERIKNPGPPDFHAVELREAPCRELSSLTGSKDNLVATALKSHARASFFSHKLNQLNEYHLPAVQALARVEEKINRISKMNDNYFFRIRKIKEDIKNKEDRYMRIKQYKSTESRILKREIDSLKKQKKAYDKKLDYNVPWPKPEKVMAYYPPGTKDNTICVYEESKDETQSVNLLELKEYLISHIIDTGFEHDVKTYNNEIVRYSYMRDTYVKNFANDSQKSEYLKQVALIDKKGGELNARLHEPAFDENGVESETSMSFDANRQSLPGDIEEVYAYTFAEKRRLMKAQIEKEDEEKSINHFDEWYKNF